MVVAVTGVRVVKVAIDQVVDVIAVRHRLVAAARTVHVTGRVPLARVTGGATGRVRRVDRDCAFVDVVVVDHVEVAVVEVVDVAAVPDGPMPAVGAMDVIVLRVNLVGAHRWIPFVCHFNE
ncbi:MAG TPA: hypothetical protein VGF94_00350 [Kofleriaceae bacterium]